MDSLGSSEQRGRKGLIPMADNQNTEHTGAEQPNEPGAEKSHIADFEQMLEQQPDYRSEFDRRVAQALKTAREKWNKEKEQELSEAERLAKMTAEQKAQHEREKAEKKLAQREADVTRRELMAEAKATLASKGLPVELADTLTYTNADACSASMEIVEKAFQTAVTKAVDARLKQPAPKAGTTGGQQGVDYTSLIEKATREGNFSAAAYYTRLSEQTKHNKGD